MIYSFQQRPADLRIALNLEKLLTVPAESGLTEQMTQILISPKLKVYRSVCGLSQIPQPSPLLPNFSSTNPKVTDHNRPVTRYIRQPKAISASQLTMTRLGNLMSRPATLPISTMPPGIIYSEFGILPVTGCIFMWMAKRKKAPLIQQRQA